jgi:hypothetical protein
MDLRGNRNFGYVVDTEYTTDRPRRIHVVNIRALPTAVNRNWIDEQWYTFIASVLREEVLTRIEESYNLRRHQIFRRGGSGVLQMMNNVHHGRHARLPMVQIQDINGHAIATLFERAQVYQEDMTFYTVNFSFWVNSASLLAGAANSSLNHVGCFKNVKYGTLIDYEGEKVQANCAAVSLEWLIYNEINSAHRVRESSRRKNFWESFTLEVYKKQLFLGWDENVTLYDIKKYLHYLPDHRIVVLTPNPYRHCDYDYTGDEYV